MIVALLGGIGESRAQVNPKGYNLEWERDNALLAQQLVYIATTAEYDRRESYVLKWVKPVLVAVQGRYRPSWLTLIKNILVTSNKLGVNVRLSESQEKANFVITFQSRRAYDRDVLKSFPANNLPACHVYNNWWEKPSKGELYKVDVYIPDDLSFEAAQECVEEEITQGLGLPNDSFTLLDSLYNDENLYDRTSATDRLFLRLLYHSEVKPGMSPESFYEVSLKLLNNWRPMYASSKGYDPEFNHETRLWEEEVRKSLSVVDKPHGLTQLTALLALGKDSNDGGAREALSHHFLYRNYLARNDYEQAVSHAKRYYEIILELMRSNSLRAAHASYHLGVALILNRQTKIGQKYVQQSKSIVDRYWPGNPLADKIKIREIGSLLEKREFEKVIYETKLFLKRMESPNLHGMNAVYLHGLAHLGKVDLAKSHQDLVTLQNYRQALPPSERITAQKILLSYQHHFTKVSNKLRLGSRP